MLKILVTGAGGQLGRSFQNVADSSEFELFFLSRAELDIADQDAVKSVLTSLQPDYLINAAAYTAVDKAEEEPAKARQINSDSVISMAELCRNLNCRFIHLSSDYVFDGNKNVPYLETDPANPLSSYGKSKRSGEEGIEHLENVLILRTSWLYSEFPGNFLQTMRRVMKQRDEVNVVYDQIGTPTYTGDLAKGIFDIIRNSESNSFTPGLFHYSNEGTGSWYDFAWEIMKNENFDVKLNPIETKDYPLPAKRPFYSVLNKEKIKQTYGLIIPHWKESLANCFNQLNT